MISYHDTISIPKIPKKKTIIRIIDSSTLDPYIDMYIRTHTHMYMYIHTHTHMYTYTRTHTHIHATCSCDDMWGRRLQYLLWHICVCYISTCIYARTRTHINSLLVWWHLKDLMTTPAVETKNTKKTLFVWWFKRIDTTTCCVKIKYKIFFLGSLRLKLIAPMCVLGGRFNRQHTSTHMNESCRRFNRQHTSTHMNESCHTYEWVMAHIWRSHGTHMNESCRRFNRQHTSTASSCCVYVCVRVCCSMLQCVAVCCSFHCIKLLRVRMCPCACVLLCVAVCCRMLKYTFSRQCACVCRRVLQCVLQCVVVWCSVL